MIKHVQTIRRQQLTNCLSVFEHFVWLALKGLKQLVVVVALTFSKAYGLPQIQIYLDDNLLPTKVDPEIGGCVKVCAMCGSCSIKT